MKYALALIFALIGLSSQALASNPSNKELIKRSVKITNLEMTSGGSGVILSSSKRSSTILTNKHVCELLVKQPPGVIEDYEHKMHIPYFLKEDDKHDLCILKVVGDLHVNIKIAKQSSKVGDKMKVVGFPSLLPVIITEGYASERMIINLMDGQRPCTPEELQDGRTAPYCLFNGGMPTVIHREARIVSNLIMGGSSGSPVWNDRGELESLIFAGMGGGLSFGFAVPLEYIRAFVK